MLAHLSAGNLFLPVLFLASSTTIQARKGELMKISRVADGFKFVGECAPETGFTPEDVHCGRCGSRIEAMTEEAEIALRCSGCTFHGRPFWSETELHVFMAEQWNLLRQACSHPAVNSIRT